jgi:hypothetical protein
MINDVVHIVRVKIRKAGYDDRAVGNRRKIRHGPVYRILPDQGYFIAPLNAGFPEQLVKPVYPFRRFAVDHGFTFVIGERGMIPAFFNRFLGVPDETFG